MKLITVVTVGTSDWQDVTMLAKRKLTVSLIIVRTKLFIRKNCSCENKRTPHFERFILVYITTLGIKNVNFLDFIVTIFRFGITYVYFVTI